MTTAVTLPPFVYSDDNQTGRPGNEPAVKTENEPAVKKKPCRGCKRKRGHERHPELHVITCHYNPAGYTRLLQNYWAFRSQFDDDQITTVELSFDGKFAIPDAIHIRGDRRSHLMWQKERLLNIALEHVDAPVIAWIDADVLFLNPHWQAETVKALKTYRAVQLFERKLDVLGDWRVDSPREGHCYAKTRPDAKWRQPGGAWAMRRDVLMSQHGLDDSHVLGGSDAMMLAAWEANFSHYLLSRMTAPWRESFLRWAVRAYAAVQGRLGFVSGDVVHLYHGTRANRKYVERWRYLTDHDFDPDKDLAIDENGLWRWDSDKPEMHAQVARYFVERDEDR